MTGRQRPLAPARWLAAARTPAPRPPGRSGPGSRDAGTPAASSSPARRLRLCARQRRGHQVAGARQPDHRLRTRAQALRVAPDLREDVSGGRPGGVQPLGLGGARGERGSVLGRARELHADRVVGLLAHDAGADEQLRERARELLVARRPRRAPRPRAPSPARAPGPPRQATRCGAEALRSGRRRRRALGRDEPLATDTTAVRRQARSRRAPRSPRPAPRGHGEEHVVRARDTRRGGLDRAAAPAARRPADRSRFSRSCSSSAACSAVRVCNVVRSPPRASSTASAVPNEPAPITVARRAPGVGSARARGAGGPGSV